MTRSPIPRPGFRPRFCRRLWRDTRGAETVEFAIVGGLLCMTVFAVIESGLLWWLKSGLEVTAAMAARCGAVGYASANAANCPLGNATATQNYALSVSNTFLMPNMITTSNITVNGRVAAGTAPCTGTGMTGNFFAVSLSSNYFNFGIPPLNNKTLTASSCFPMP